MFERPYSGKTSGQAGRRHLSQDASPDLFDELVGPHGLLWKFSASLGDCLRRYAEEAQLAAMPPYTLKSGQTVRLAFSPVSVVTCTEERWASSFDYAQEAPVYEREVSVTNRAFVRGALNSIGAPASEPPFSWIQGEVFKWQAPSDGKDGVGYFFVPREISRIFRNDPGFKEYLSDRLAVAGFLLTAPDLPFLRWWVRVPLSERDSNQF